MKDILWTWMNFLCVSETTKPNIGHCIGLAQIWNPCWQAPDKFPTSVLVVEIKEDIHSVFLPLGLARWCRCFRDLRSASYLQPETQSHLTALCDVCEKSIKFFSCQNTQWWKPGCTCFVFVFVFLQGTSKTIKPNRVRFSRTSLWALSSAHLQPLMLHQVSGSRQPPWVLSLGPGRIEMLSSSCCKLWKCQTCRLTVASRLASLTGPVMALPSNDGIHPRSGSSVLTQLLHRTCIWHWTEGGSRAKAASSKQFYVLA